MSGILDQPWVSYAAKAVVIAVLLWLYVQLRRYQALSRTRAEAVAADAADGRQPVATPLPAGPAGEEESLSTLHGAAAAVSPVSRAKGKLPSGPPGAGAKAGAEEFYLSLLLPILSPRYEEVVWVAHGGAGVVFRARDREEGRAVAIKMLSPLLADDQRAVARFDREARILHSLRHPGVVRVVEVSGEGTPYFVMEWVDGVTLTQRVNRDGPLPCSEAAALGWKAARALGAAHAIGLLHRDVKPDNLILKPDGGTKWIDFGLAHVEHLTRLTKTGEVMGTPAAMAPEQIEGDRTVPATDVYGMGVTLFYAVAGRYPFEGNALFHHVNTPPPELASAAAGVPPWLGDIVRRCLAKRPEERYADGEALAQALESRVSSAQDPLAPGGGA